MNGVVAHISILKIFFMKNDNEMKWNEKNDKIKRWDMWCYELRAQLVHSGCVMYDVAIARNKANTFNCNY